MTEGWEWRKDGNGARMGMAEGVEMAERADFGIDADCAPHNLAPRSPDVSRGRLPDSRVRPLTACMRTLLVILSAMLKHHTPWRDLSPNSAHCVEDQHSCYVTS